jgi:hypothetical protein
LIQALAAESPNSPPVLISQSGNSFKLPVPVLVADIPALCERIAKVIQTEFPC